MQDPTKLPRLLHPALALALFWALIYGFYWVAPIQQTPPISARGLLFVGAMMLVYAISSALAASGPTNESVNVPDSSLATHSHPASDTLTRLFLTIGILGTGLNMFARLQSIDDFSFADAAVLRAERAQLLLEAADPASSVFTGIAFLCYPAGFVALTAAMLRFESLSQSTRVLSGLYAVLIFLHGIAAGGRSSLLVLILLVAISLYVRRCRGLPAVPRSKLLILIMSGAIVGFLGYSTAVWQVRADLAEFEVEDFLAHADQVWGVIPAPALERFADAIDNQSLLVSVTSSLFYVTQSLAIVERILAARDLPVLLGAYHIDVVAALLRAFPASAAFLGQGYDKLLQENTEKWGPAGGKRFVIDLTL